MSTDHGPSKPSFGAPCNGCGFCCAAEPCGVAIELLGVVVDSGPCPALQFEDGRFWCGLIRHPSAYIGSPEKLNGLIGQTIALAIGAGRGCDSDAPATGEFAGKNLWDARTRELAAAQPLGLPRLACADGEGRVAYSDDEKEMTNREQ